MDDISAVIEKSRDDLSNQRGELQKSIEKVTAEWRADGHTSLTTQVRYTQTFIHFPSPPICPKYNTSSVFSASL